MRRVLALFLAIVVSLAFAGAVLPERAQAQAPACHDAMPMAMPGHALPMPSHGLHACCLMCAGVLLQAPLGNRAAVLREEAVRFTVMGVALSGRMTPPALGPPKLFV